jgi:hypothetical protein
MSDDTKQKNSLDLVGLGQAAKAIPPEAWNEIVSTVTSTFKELVKPFTAITGGLGGLIEQKFSNMADVQKVLLADGLKKIGASLNWMGKSRRDFEV